MTEGPTVALLLLDPGPRPGAVAFSIRTCTGKTIGEVRHLLVTPGSVITIGVRYDWVDLQTELLDLGATIQTVRVPSSR